ncbi:hypothetical protein SAMN04487905_103349 [Actinopolyspora xinjiangensis]|uniref:Uncharacterized protein n=1 Tax=Actinopolyspora xinjiangensis TaxID=405564 RepID=A0A1H0S2F0_9ACTN|nr:hypothetical protein [Actinopolyspora xinjiangensis]SDP35913.1 hypothetical protein SAMN04487905_103349 [Actinopolyspora xinjiangensis]
MNRTKRISLWAGALVGAVGIAFGVGWFFVMPTQPGEAEATYAFKLDTPKKAAGWADDVFVARITSKIGSENSPSGIPYTKYRAEVVSTLKGKAEGTVRVARIGSENPVTRDNVRVGDSPSLRAGQTYVLASRLNTQAGWHNVPSSFEPSEVSGIDDPAMEQWKNAVKNGKLPQGAKPSQLDRSISLNDAYGRLASTERAPTGAAEFVFGRTRQSDRKTSFSRTGWSSRRRGRPTTASR